VGLAGLVLLKVAKASNSPANKAKLPGALINSPVVLSPRVANRDPTVNKAVVRPKAANPVVSPRPTALPSKVATNVAFNRVVALVLPKALPNKAPLPPPPSPNCLASLKSKPSPLPNNAC